MSLKKLVLIPLIGMLVACGNGMSDTAIDFYSGDQLDKNGLMAFNYDLFYRNDEKIGGPDPFIFDNTERDGYYYMLSTIGLYYMGRSKDCMNWEGVGSALCPIVGTTGSTLKNTLYTNYWAPEIVYDKDEQLYYLFCSANSNYGGDIYTSNSFVGVSDKASGPYYICNFKKEGLDFNYATGETGVPSAALHNTYNTSTYSQTFAKYVMLEPGVINDKIEEVIRTSPTTKRGKYIGSIDFHPYTDPVTGNKYLYFVSSQKGTFCIFGVKMKTWLIPDWDTFNLMAAAGYYNTSDFKSGYDNKPTYETNDVNEGPAVTYHNGKYYMTMSNGDYNNSTYSLIQAVSDSPLGPWRKLTADENGLVMSSQLQGSEDVSSCGHNGFVQIGDELYIVYHKHKSFNIGGSDRIAAIDKVKWLTINDINGNPLDVMYVNGPLSTIQPRIAKYADYVNVAPQATVSLESGELGYGSALSYLNDDYLSLYKTDNATTALVKETELAKTSTIKFSFENKQNIRAVMAYTSKRESDIFKRIDNITITYLDDAGNEKKATMNNIELNKSFYRELEEFNEIIYITPGAHAFAEFNEIKNVKDVSLTFSVTNDRIVGLSEIVILGGK